MLVHYSVMVGREGGRRGRGKEGGGKKGEKDGEKAGGHQSFIVSLHITMLHCVTS